MRTIQVSRGGEASWCKMKIKLSKDEEHATDEFASCPVRINAPISDTKTASMHQLHTRPASTPSLVHNSLQSQPHTQQQLQSQSQAQAQAQLPINEGPKIQDNKKQIFYSNAIPKTLVEQHSGPTCGPLNQLYHCKYNWQSSRLLYLLTIVVFMCNMQILTTTIQSASATSNINSVWLSQDASPSLSSSQKLSHSNSTGKLAPKPTRSSIDLATEASLSSIPNQQTLLASYSSLQPAVVSLEAPDVTFGRRDDPSISSNPTTSAQIDADISRRVLQSEPMHGLTLKRFRLAHINSNSVDNASQFDHLWDSDTNNHTTNPVTNQTILNQQVHFDEEQHNSRQSSTGGSNQSQALESISTLDKLEKIARRRSMSTGRRRPNEDAESTFVGSVGANRDDGNYYQVEDNDKLGFYDKAAAPRATSVIRAANATTLDQTAKTGDVSELIYHAIPFESDIRLVSNTTHSMAADLTGRDGAKQQQHPEYQQGRPYGKPTSTQWSEVLVANGGSKSPHPVYYLERTGDKWTINGQQQNHTLDNKHYGPKTAIQPMGSPEDDQNHLISVIDNDPVPGRVKHRVNANDLVPPMSRFNYDQNGWPINPAVLSQADYLVNSVQPQQTFRATNRNQLLASGQWPTAEFVRPKSVMTIQHQGGGEIPIKWSDQVSKQWFDVMTESTKHGHQSVPKIATKRYQNEQDHLRQQHRRRNLLLQQHQGRLSTNGRKSILGTLAAQLPRLGGVVGGGASLQQHQTVDEESFYDTPHNGQNTLVKGSNKPIYHQSINGRPPTSRRPLLAQNNYWKRPTMALGQHRFRIPAMNPTLYGDQNSFYQNQAHLINRPAFVRPSITPGDIRHPTVAPAVSQLRQLYPNLHLTSSLAPHNGVPYRTRLHRSNSQLAVAASVPTSSNHLGDHHHLPSSNFIPVVAVQVTRTSPAPSNPTMVAVNEPKFESNQQPQHAIQVVPNEVSNTELDEYLEAKTGQVNRQLLAQIKLNNNQANQQRVGQQHTVSTPVRQRVAYPTHQSEDFGSLASGSVSAPIRPQHGATIQLHGGEHHNLNDRYNIGHDGRQQHLGLQPASGSETTTIKSAVFGYLPHQADGPLLQAINLLPQLSDSAPMTTKAPSGHHLNLRTQSLGRQHQFRSDASEQQQLAAYVAAANAVEQQQPSLALQLQANSLVQNDIVHPFGSIPSNNQFGLANLHHRPLTVTENAQLLYAGQPIANSRSPSNNQFGGLYTGPNDQIEASLAAAAQQQYNQLMLNNNQQHPDSDSQANGNNLQQQAHLLANNPLALLAQLDQQALASSNNLQQQIGPTYGLASNLHLQQYPFLFPVSNGLGNDENNESPSTSDGELGTDESNGSPQSGDNNIDQVVSTTSSSRNRAHQITSSGKKRSSEFFANAGQLLISALPLLLAPTLGLMFSNSPSFGAASRLQQASGVSSSTQTAGHQSVGASQGNENAGFSPLEGLVSSAGSKAHLFTPTPLENHYSAGGNGYVSTGTTNATNLMASSSDNGFRQIISPSTINNNGSRAFNDSTLQMQNNSTNRKDKHPSNSLQVPVTLPALTGFKYPNRSSTSPRPTNGNRFASGSSSTSTLAPLLISSRSNYSTTVPPREADQLLFVPGGDRNRNNNNSAASLNHQLTNGSFIKLDDYFKSSPENQTIISPTTILFLSNGLEDSQDLSTASSENHTDHLMEVTRRVSTSLLASQNNQTKSYLTPEFSSEHLNSRINPFELGYDGADFDAQFATLRRPSHHYHRGGQQSVATTTSTTKQPRTVLAAETKRPSISYYSTTNSTTRNYALIPDRNTAVPNSSMRNRNKYQYAEIKPTLSPSLSADNASSPGGRDQLTASDSRTDNLQTRNKIVQEFNLTHSTLPRRRGQPPSSSHPSGISFGMPSGQSLHKITIQDDSSNNDPMTTELYPVSTWPQARRRTVSLVTSAGNRTLLDSSDKYRLPNDSLIESLSTETNDNWQLRSIDPANGEHPQQQFSSDRNRYQIMKIHPQPKQANSNETVTREPNDGNKRLVKLGTANILGSSFSDQAAKVTKMRPQRIRVDDFNYSADLDDRRARYRRLKREIDVADQRESRVSVGPLSSGKFATSEHQEHKNNELVIATTMSMKPRASVLTEQQIKKRRRRKLRRVAKLNPLVIDSPPITLNNTPAETIANDSILLARSSIAPIGQVSLSKRMSDNGDLVTFSPASDTNETLRRDASRSKSAIVTAMITQVADENDEDAANKDASNQSESQSEFGDSFTSDGQFNYTSELRKHLLERKSQLDRIASTGGLQTDTKGRQQFQPQAASSEILDDQNDITEQDNSILIDPIDGRLTKRLNSDKVHTNRASKPLVGRKNVAAALELADDTKKALAKFGTLLLEDTLVQLPEPSRAKSEQLTRRKKLGRVTKGSIAKYQLVNRDSDEKHDDEVNSATERYATRTATQVPPRASEDASANEEIGHDREPIRQQQRNHRNARIPDNQHERTSNRRMQGNLVAAHNESEISRWLDGDRARTSSGSYDRFNQNIGGGGEHLEARYSSYNNYTTTVAPLNVRDPRPPLEHHSYNYYNGDTYNRDYSDSYADYPRRHQHHPHEDPNDNQEHRYAHSHSPSLNYSSSSYPGSYYPPLPSMNYNRPSDSRTLYPARPHVYSQHHDYHHLHNRSAPLSGPVHSNQNHTVYNREYSDNMDHIGHPATPPTVQPRYHWPPEQYPPGSGPNASTSEYYSRATRQPANSAVYHQNYHSQQYQYHNQHQQNQHNEPSGNYSPPPPLQASLYAGSNPLLGEQSVTASGSRLTDSRSVNEYLRRVQFSDSDRDKLMASYLTCDGLLNDNDHCLERLSCEFSDPLNIEKANKLDRAVSSILLGHILINTYIPNQFKLRLKSASLFGYTQSGRCSKYICNKLSQSTSATVQRSSIY